MAKNLQNAREKAYARQRGLCYYCKASVPRGAATVDHKVPRALGGNLRDGNAVMACRECNQDKGSLTAVEFIAARSRRPDLPPARVHLWQRADALARPVNETGTNDRSTALDPDTADSATARDGAK